MKNELVNPELVRFFVALDRVYNELASLSETEGTFLDGLAYKSDSIELINTLTDARFHLSELINIDIVQRAKATKRGMEINLEF